MITLDGILDSIEEAMSGIMILLQAEDDGEIPTSDMIDDLFQAWTLLREAAFLIRKIGVLS